MEIGSKQLGACQQWIRQGSAVNSSDCASHAAELHFRTLWQICSQNKSAKLFYLPQVHLPHYHRTEFLDREWELLVTTKASLDRCRQRAKLLQLRRRRRPCCTAGSKKPGWPVPCDAVLPTRSVENTAIYLVPPKRYDRLQVSEVAPGTCAVWSVEVHIPSEPPADALGDSLSAPERRNGEAGVRGIAG